LLWNPRCLVLGQRHDIIKTMGLIKSFRHGNIIAYKSYDDQGSLKTRLQSVIPHLSNTKNPREYDGDLSKDCHFVECFLVKLKTLEESFLSI
jgi:hypothetical protein